jgi:hypothetical protein
MIYDDEDDEHHVVASSSYLPDDDSYDDTGAAPLPVDPAPQDPLPPTDTGGADEDPPAPPPPPGDDTGHGGAPNPPPEPPPTWPAGRTTVDGVSLQQILLDRPDVLRAFYEEFYGSNNDHHSHAWMERVGGNTPEDYANFWYNTSGKLEGYVPSAGPGGSHSALDSGRWPGDHFSTDGIDLDQILRERPDVMKAFYDGFFGPNNDRHSSAWVDRVGGTTAQDYANYWYHNHGIYEGYSQDMAWGSRAAPPPPEPDPIPDPVEPEPEPAEPVLDPADQVTVGESLTDPSQALAI